MTASALSVTSAAKAYGEVTLFSKVTFELLAGAAVAVVGANGAGKSTLLRCIAGSDELDEGTVAVFGRPFDESDAMVRRAVAALLDDVDYFPDLSVLEHLRLIAWLHGTDDAEAVTESVIGDVGLDGVRHQLPPTLSSGQKHRLGLASCLVRPRRVLLLDEPEQRLDEAGRAWLRSRLLGEKRAGTAVLFSSHDPLLVAEVADHVVAL
jgi:ABC-2 type transport system ATP-binding protein